jgi:hypothetical protein
MANQRANFPLTNSLPSGQQGVAWYQQVAQTRGDMLRPPAARFTYGENTRTSSATRRNSWQQAAATNGAGPNADNSAAPWSFTQFVLGINPFTKTNWTSKKGTDGGIAPALIGVGLIVLVFLFVTRRV